MAAALPEGERPVVDDNCDIGETWDRVIAQIMQSVAKICAPIRSRASLFGSLSTIINSDPRGSLSATFNSDPRADGGGFYTDALVRETPQSIRARSLAIIDSRASAEGAS